MAVPQKARDSRLPNPDQSRRGKRQASARANSSRGKRDRHMDHAAAKLMAGSFDRLRTSKLAATKSRGAQPGVAVPQKTRNAGLPTRSGQVPPGATKAYRWSLFLPAYGLFRSCLNRILSGKNEPITQEPPDLFKKTLSISL